MRASSSRFIRSFGHELGNGLLKVISNLELALAKEQGETMPQSVENRIHSALSASLQMGTMIRVMQGYPNSEIETNVNSTSIREVFDSTLQHLPSLSHEWKGRIELKLPNDIQVLANRDLLAWAFQVLFLRWAENEIATFAVTMKCLGSEVQIQFDRNDAQAKAPPTLAIHVCQAAVSQSGGRIEFNPTSKEKQNAVIIWLKQPC